MSFSRLNQYVTECFLLGGDSDAEGVWRGDEQAHRGNHHVETSWPRHKPLAALRVVLQDALISFHNTFLKHADHTELYLQDLTLLFYSYVCGCKNVSYLVLFKVT